MVRLQLSCGILFAAAVHGIALNVTSLTQEVESDWSAVYYPAEGDAPLLLGNDGEASTGGFHVWSLDGNSVLNEVKAVTPGRRTKLVSMVYGIDGKDYVVTIGQPDSIIRLFELPEVVEAANATYTAIGDWSALCAWKSNARNQYFYLFGKNQAIQFLVRGTDGGPEILEVQTFKTPIEASACAAAPSTGTMFFTGDDSKDVYAFALAESTTAPEISKIAEAGDDVTGIATYVAPSAEYLFITQTDVVGVYDAASLDLVGSLELGGLEDIEVQCLAIYQGGFEGYAGGAITCAVEADDFKGFGVSPLEDALQALSISVNTAYDPRHRSCKRASPICQACSSNGYCSSTDTCSCFTGFSGPTCSDIQCTNDCSGHGTCVGPNQCACEAGWGGINCAFALIEATYETEANGGDGDDPAIWISPEDPEKSRIYTTTKSGDETGLGVFDLQGNFLQFLAAGEPNNIDVIYGFQAGDRTIDLAYAACREDNTLCLFEITSNGTLANIAGGTQPTPEDYEVYGSCTYKSRLTGKQYLFVNAKSAEYLQYELTATSNGTLETTLVRTFTGGSGGQVEGCVSDEENGWVFIGEEPYALWRFDAEPDSTADPVAVATVDDDVTVGKLYGDVEGVTLVVGPSPSQGFVLVSCQGVSAYNVYRRAPPHAYVGTFSISASADGSIDAVTNTDGIAAVGTALGPDFPRGLFVTHDDANELSGGGTAAEASFKLVSLETIFEALSNSDTSLLDEIDSEWDPRAEV